MNHKVRYFLRVLSLAMVSCFTLNGSAQNKTELLDRDLLLRTQTYGDSIKLRWAPTSPELWRLANQVGYQLIRTTISRAGKSLPSKAQARKILAQNLKPKPAEDWLPIVENDEMAFLAAGILYGEGFEVQPEIKSKLDIVGAYEAQLSEEYQYGYCLYAADHSFQTALALGIAWVDLDVKSDESYIYEISLMSEAKLDPLPTTKKMIIANEPGTLPAPSYFNAYFDDLKVGLQWNGALQKTTYCSYEVERSSDGGTSFQRVNENPVVFVETERQKEFVVFTDSLANNEQVYFYRVRGKTPFGDFSPYSELVEGHGIPRPIPIRAEIYSVSEFPEGMIQLRWEFDTTYLDKIKGFDIYRSVNGKENFVRLTENLIPSNKFIFTDETPLLNAYYKVVVIDENDYELPSFKALALLKDNIAPEAPTGLQGDLDAETGIVTLNWNPNQEEDLQGYRVFRTIDEEANYFQITKGLIRDTIFYDTVSMNTTSEKIFYKILAADYRDNFSYKSEACIVQRPDQHGPTIPVFSTINASTKSINLAWASSSSSDVIWHQLQRKALNQENWEVLMIYEENMPFATYTDTTAFKDQYYKYRVAVSDDAQNVNYSKMIQSKIVDDHQREGIIDPMAKAIPQSKVVRLSWRYDRLETVKEFVIYRAAKDQQISTYQIIPDNEIRISNASEFGQGGDIYFEDRNVTRGGKYVYRILAKHKDGGFSPLTEPIQSQL